MFPADYLRAAGYRVKPEQVVTAGDAARHPELTEGTETLPAHLSLWLDPEGNTLTYAEARAKLFGSCQCCGEPAAYGGALRCGAACNAMHEAKDCLCYGSDMPAKLRAARGNRTGP